MNQQSWLTLVYLLGYLVLVLPALAMYRRSGSRLWRDIAIWLAVACTAALAYRLLAAR